MKYGAAAVKGADAICIPSINSRSGNQFPYQPHDILLSGKSATSLFSAIHCWEGVCWTSQLKRKQLRTTIFNGTETDTGLLRHLLLCNYWKSTFGSKCRGKGYLGCLNHHLKKPETIQCRKTTLIFQKYHIHAHTFHKTSCALSVRAGLQNTFPVSFSAVGIIACTEKPPPQILNQGDNRSMNTILFNTIL